MMYKEKLVVVLRSNGKILREHGDTIHIPFGSEYSLSFKNLENRKAVATVEIDGVNVLGSYSSILNPGEEVNLERFITNGNLYRGNKFKFIKKTKEISDYRGDKIDDGLIRIEFRFEKEQEIPITTWSTYSYYTSGDLGRKDVCESYNMSKTRSFSNFTSTLNRKDPDVPYRLCDYSFANFSDISDDGITVKGSMSNQGFYFGSIGQLEDKSYTMVFNLKGYDSSKVKIQKPVTVRTKLQCESCGRKSKSSNQYCPKCGTSLI